MSRAAAPPQTHVPPQNIEAEESVLGAMLVAEPALTRVIDEVQLNAADFYLDRHRLMFACAHDLYARSKPVDELSVSEALTQRNQLEEVGGKHYVSELAAKVPAAGNAKHYAEIVQQNSLLRRLLGAGQEIQGWVNDRAGEPGELSERAFERLAQIRQHSAVSANGEIATICGADVRLRVPRFLDADGMIPTRSNTVVFGRAGLGKTLYGLSQCAAVTTGRMPGLEGPAPVLISSLEDDPEAVLGPRLVAMGADLSLVHFTIGLSLPSEVPKLANKARSAKAALVLIDPIAAHLDASIDSHNDASTRSALLPLQEMAMELEMSVLIVAHPNKSTGGNSLDKISGSGAFGNAARSVIVFGLDPTDPDGETGDRRLIGHLKNNVGKKAATIAARIELEPVETEEGTGLFPHLRVTGFSDHRAEDVLSSPTGEERSERDEAREFLSEQLGDGPVRSKELKGSAEQNGLTWRTVERAKRDLGIKAVQTADGWYWLPIGETKLEGLGR